MLRNITRLTAQSQRLVAARYISASAPALRRKDHKHDDTIHQASPDLSRSSDTQATPRFNTQEIADQQSQNHQGLGLGNTSTSRKDPSMARPGEDDINDRVRNAPTLQFDDSANRLNEPRPSGEQTRQAVPGGASQLMGNEGGESVGTRARDAPEWLRTLDNMSDLNAQDQSRRSNTDIGSESILSGQGNQDTGASDLHHSEIHVSAGGSSRSSASHGAPGTEFSPDELYRPGIDQAKGSDYQGQAKAYIPKNIQAKQHDAGMSQQSQGLGTSQEFGKTRGDAIGENLGLNDRSDSGMSGGQEFGKTRGDSLNEGLGLNNTRSEINRQAIGSQPQNMTNPLAQAAETIAQGLNPVLSKGMEVVDSIRDTVKSILDPDANVDKNRYTRDFRDEMKNRDEFSDRSDRSGRNNN